MYVNRFPNCFIIMNNVQSGVTANYPHILDEQARHVAYVVKHGLEHQVRTIEVSSEAEGAWVETIMGLAVNRIKFLQECTPGYYNNEGKPSPLVMRNGSY